MKNLAGDTGKGVKKAPPIRNVTQVEPDMIKHVSEAGCESWLFATDTPSYFQDFCIVFQHFDILGNTKQHACAEATGQRSARWQ